MSSAITATAVVVRIVSSALALAALGALVSRQSAVVGLVLGTVLGTVHGAAIGIVRPYRPTARGWFMLAVDHTWSLLNTVVGSVFLVINLVMGNRLDHALSQGRTTVVLKGGVFPGFATTIGNVEAGTRPHIANHEFVHVLQARLFGPLYLPTVMANYVVATVLPYWLIYHDHVNHRISSLGDYFMKGVYPHVWNEEWAYRVEGTPP